MRWSAGAVVGVVGDSLAERLPLAERVGELGGMPEPVGVAGGPDWPPKLRTSARSTTDPLALDTPVDPGLGGAGGPIFLGSIGDRDQEFWSMF